MHLVAWDKICHPKQLGGLGIRKRAAVNTAFLAKLGWKFLTQPENYWVQQVRAKYGSTEQFFACRSMRSDSWVWKCLLKLRPFIKQGMRWKVGNGKTIKFQTDSWCLEDSLINILEFKPTSPTEADITVSEFITPDKLQDTNKLRRCVPEDIVQCIQGILIPYTNVEDSFCWGFTGSGDFSTKSATWRAHEASVGIIPFGHITAFGNQILCRKSKFSCGNYATKLCLREALYSVGASILTRYARPVILILKIPTIFLFNPFGPKSLGDGCSTPVATYHPICSSCVYAPRRPPIIVTQPASPVNKDSATHLEHLEIP